MTFTSSVVVGADDLSLDDVLDAVRGRPVVLTDDPARRDRIARGARAMADHVERGAEIYGVTTGFGDSCENRVDPSFAVDLQHNLLRYHGCGVGSVLPDDAALAVLVVRLATLARGLSGVRIELLEALAALVRHRILPRIPEHGSVGASGDLTPLSYVAAALVGERTVTFEGREVPARAALEACGLSPLRLAPKEGLALMNGTSVMTALGILGWDRARRLLRWATANTALAADGLASNRRHFDPRLDAAKPHPGQRKVAAWLRADLGFDPKATDPRKRLQDRYSIRCAPHVLGVLADAVDLAERVLTVELNSANDNPLVDPETGDVLSGGNFYGGHVAFALDALKTAVANACALMDRQMALLCGAETNNGLPANLVAPGEDASARHGFKAMQISASALCAEALKNTMPASVFSRSTECHNQDIVSMGMHAARDLLRVLDVTEPVAAILTLAGCQAVDLRGLDGAGPRARALHGAVRAHVPMVTADRAQDGDIACILELHREGRLPVGDLD
ncbi:MAG: aromatic amino acid lyase [Deltaproteobacteria bacterium]|nr:MAG: aromatic amino acid lyase [Deltaproteobacteria bacterium]